jgi:hypothetical protein
MSGGTLDFLQALGSGRRLTEKGARQHNVRVERQRLIELGGRIDWTQVAEQLLAVSSRELWVDGSALHGQTRRETQIARPHSYTPDARHL